jgi:hypothetical protein
MTYLETVPRKVIRQKLKAVYPIVFASNTETHSVVRKRKPEDIRQEQQHLVRVGVSRGCRDVAFYAANLLNLAYKSLAETNRVTAPEADLPSGVPS